MWRGLWNRLRREGKERVGCALTSRWVHTHRNPALPLVGLKGGGCRPIVWAWCIYVWHQHVNNSSSTSCLNYWCLKDYRNSQQKTAVWKEGTWCKMEKRIRNFIIIYSSFPKWASHHQMENGLKNQTKEESKPQKLHLAAYLWFWLNYETWSLGPLFCCVWSPGVSPAPGHLMHADALHTSSLYLWLDLKTIYLFFFFQLQILHKTSFGFLSFVHIFIKKCGVRTEVVTSKSSSDRAVWSLQPCQVTKSISTAENKCLAHCSDYLCKLKTMHGLPSTSQVFGLVSVCHIKIPR